MTQPTSSPDSPFAAFPPALVGMLRDDATLSVALSVLEESRRENLARTDEINARKPALGGILASKKDREDYQAALKTVQIQRASIDRLITRATLARERVQPGLREALLAYLSTHDPIFQRGIQASRLHSHWAHQHAIVVDRMKGFVRDLRETAAALAEDAKNGRPIPSNHATWKITTVRTAAAELERTLSELNAVAAEQAAAVDGTPLAAARLPFAEAWPCINEIDTLTVCPIPEAAASAARLLNDYLQIRQPALDTLEGMFKVATVEYSHLSEAALRNRWQELVILAETHLVGDAELEPALADIERRLLEAERIRLNQQFDNQAFTHDVR
jgi:hypothetical protein